MKIFPCQFEGHKPNKLRNLCTIHKLDKSKLFDLQCINCLIWSKDVEYKELEFLLDLEKILYEQAKE
jgi:hypothetical protein